MILLAGLIYYLRTPRPQSYGWSAGQSRTRVLALPSGLAVLNLLLAGAILTMLAFYVVSSNDITAKEYGLKTLGDRLTALQEFNSRLSAEQLHTESHSSIAGFADSHDMVPAGETVRIIVNNSVAFSR